MENEENSKDHPLMREVGRTFLVAAAYGAGVCVGMAAGVYALKAIQKNNPIVQTPSVTTE